jgi:hypothetical protein
MATRHEAPKHKIPQLHFQPEQFATEDDPEFFDELLLFLQDHKYDTDNLLYSGFDAQELIMGRGIPKYDVIYAMNEAGWRKALKLRTENPASHAFGAKVPALGLYDRTQLAEARPHGMVQDLDSYSERIGHSEIEKRESLTDLPADRVIEETVVHKDYPGASPTDALLGIVFLQPFGSKPARDHGL